MLCAHPEAMAGAEDVNVTVYIISNLQRGVSCSLGVTKMTVIATLTAPVRSHIKSTTDFALTGSWLALEIMLTSHK